MSNAVRPAGFPFQSMVLEYHRPLILPFSY